MQNAFRQVKFIIQTFNEQKDALVTDYGMNSQQLTDLQADVDNQPAINGQPRETGLIRE